MGKKKRSRMDPDLPKGKQYRSICPERPLANYAEETSNPKEFKLAQIRAEAAVARHEEATRDSVEKAKWTAVGQVHNIHAYLVTTSGCLTFVAARGL